MAAGIIAAITWWVGNSARTQALTGWYGVLGVIVAIEFIWQPAIASGRENQ
jgi:hypothetical protein